MIRNALGQPKELTASEVSDHQPRRLRINPVWPETWTELSTEARGQCWERSRAFVGSPTRPHLLAHELLLQLPSGLLLPPKFWLVAQGLGDSANSFQEGMLKPASSKDCWHLRTAWKHGAVPPPMCVIIISAMAGCRSLTMRQSAQLAQCAPPRDRCALVNPRPPAKRGNVEITLAKGGALGEPKIVRMQLHTSSSWRTANVSVSSGRTALNQKFALGEPHINRSNHANCGSFNQGIRWKRV